MVNKCGIKGSKRTGHRHHEQNGPPQQQQQQRRGNNDELSPQLQVAINKNRAYSQSSIETIDWFGYKYEIEHIEEAINSSEEEVSHKHFDDNRQTPTKRANTRFRRHSTPAAAHATWDRDHHQLLSPSCQQEQEQEQEQLSKQPKVILRYVPRSINRQKQNYPFVDCIDSDCPSPVSSSSEDEDEDEDDVVFLDHVGSPSPTAVGRSELPALTTARRRRRRRRRRRSGDLRESSPPLNYYHHHYHHHHHHHQTHNNPSKLTRKERRQIQLRKIKEKEARVTPSAPALEVREIYADDSDASLDMTEINEIEQKYFEQQRKQEIQRLTEEWKIKMEMQASENDNNKDQNDRRRRTHLPPEILDLIFDFMGRDDFNVGILYVCKAWYSVGIEHLYKEPRINVHNYLRFVEALGNKSHLGHMVKRLDLRNIIQSGRPSNTAKILRRCNASLQVFIAPQTSFGYAPLVALKNCKQLRTLDLSLVSETVDLRVLFSAIANAKQLERLDFPRSSVFCQDYNHMWPESVWNLGLAGGISNEFLQETSFPTTITHLTMSHCPFVNSDSVRNLAVRLGPFLTSLRVLYPLPALRPNTFDTVLKLCTKLESLIISVDYITRHIFSEPNLPHDEFGKVEPHPLKRLTLDSSGSLGQARKIDADDISLAVMDDKLPHLTHVRISSKLGWNPSAEEMTELVELLDDKDGGVWIYNHLD